MTVATVDNTSFTAGPSDADDVALAASGDRRAFERVYRTHVNRVFAVCARMVADRALAEELTQDVFVRAWSKLGLYRGESAFTTWLHRLAVNVVLNARKSEGRNRSRFGSEPDEVDSLPHARARAGPKTRRAPAVLPRRPSGTRQRRMPGRRALARSTGCERSSCATGRSSIRARRRSSKRT